jgi:predicted small lipoprotein YifL
VNGGMRAPSTRFEGLRTLVAAYVLSGAAACGGGKTPVQVPPDAQVTDAADADAPDAPDEAVDVAVDADAPARDAALADRADGEAGDVAAEMPTRDASDARADAAVEAHMDAAMARPSATASWTLSPFPLCTAAGAGCMDTGAVGGYQITASGACPTASDIQLWFPGGAAPVAVGSYVVKSASGILDVVAMPAGMVGVLAERDDASMTQSRFWGRSGSVTVTAMGGARHVTFTGVSLKEETSGAAATLGADVTCP